MDQREGGREMEGEVVFGRDTKSNLLKAVSGTEWMYRRGVLERGRRVSVHAVCCVCVNWYSMMYGRYNVSPMTVFIRYSVC